MTDDLKPSDGPPADLDRTNIQPLTAEDLAEIKASAKEFLGYGTIYPEGTGLDNNGILWLIAERARLRELIKDAEWTGEPGYGDHAWCPWCGRDSDKTPHTDDCPAFTPTGEVK